MDSDRFFALAGRLPPDLRDAIAQAPLPYRRLRSDLRLPKPGWMGRMSDCWIEDDVAGVLRFLGLGEEYRYAVLQLVSNLRRGEGDARFPRLVERSQVMDRAAAELRATGDMPRWVEEVVENVRRDLEAEEAGETSDPPEVQGSEVSPSSGAIEMRRQSSS